jgi:hypothetical protein
MELLMTRQQKVILRNHLVIVGSFLPFSFSTDYVQQTCRVLARNNTVIVFLWGEALTFKEMLTQRVFIKSLSNIVLEDRGVTLFMPIHYIPLRRFE